MPPKRQKLPSPITLRLPKKPPSLRERLNNFAGLISLLGLLIFALTFLTNDILREDLKEKGSLLQSVRTTWMLKSSLDQIALDVAELRRQSGSSFRTSVETPPSTLEETMLRISSGKKQLFSLRDRVKLRIDTSHLLFAELPKRIRNEFVHSEKDLKNDLSSSETLLRRAVITRPPRNLGEAKQQLENVTEAIDAYNGVMAAFYDEEDQVKSLFESEAASSDRHLRTLGYFSVYFLYPLSILIGIFGQFVGIKHAGGE
jgi:hypothetical protein